MRRRIPPDEGERELCKCPTCGPITGVAAERDPRGAPVMAMRRSLSGSVVRDDHASKPRARPHPPAIRGVRGHPDHLAVIKAERPLDAGGTLAALKAQGERQRVGEIIGGCLRQAFGGIGHQWRIAARIERNKNNSVYRVWLWAGGMYAIDILLTQQTAALTPQWARKRTYSGCQRRREVRHVEPSGSSAMPASFDGWFTRPGGGRSRSPEDVGELCSRGASASRGA